MSVDRKSVRNAIKRDELNSLITMVVRFFKDFIPHHTRIIRNISIGVIIICVAFTLYLVKKNSEDKNAEVIMSNAMDEYKQEKYEDALVHFREVHTKHGMSKYKGISLYYSGNCYFNLGKYDEALEYFNKAASLGVLPLIKFQSMEGSAYCYEQKKDYKKAGEILFELTKKVKMPFLRAEALFNLARCYELQGKTEDAKKTYQEIKDSYINSSWANQATARLEMIK